MVCLVKIIRVKTVLFGCDVEGKNNKNSYQKLRLINLSGEKKYASLFIAQPYLWPRGLQAQKEKGRSWLYSKQSDKDQPQGYSFDQENSTVHF